MFVKRCDAGAYEAQFKYAYVPFVVADE